MISIFQHMQGGTGAQPLYDFAEKIGVRKLVTVSLNEQHRCPDILQVRGALRAGSAGGVQWERQKSETLHANQRRQCLCLRGHAPAERPAARDERQIRCEPRGRGDGGANRCMAKRGRIRPPALTLHVGELITQDGDAALRESGCHGLHRRVLHPCAGPVRQDEYCPRLAGPIEHSGHAVIRADIYRQPLGIRSAHGLHVTPEAAGRRKERARGVVLAILSTN